MINSTGLRMPLTYIVVASDGDRSSRATAQQVTASAGTNSDHCSSATAARTVGGSVPTTGTTSDTNHG